MVVGGGGGLKNGKKEGQKGRQGSGELISYALGQQVVTDVLYYTTIAKEETKKQGTSHLLYPIGL